MEIVKEVPTPVGASSSKPRTPLSKRGLSLMDEEGQKPLVHGTGKRARRSPEQSSSTCIGSIGESSPFSFERKSFFEVQEAMAAVEKQNKVAGHSAQSTVRPK